MLQSAVQSAITVPGACLATLAPKKSTSDCPGVMAVRAACRTKTRARTFTAAHACRGRIATVLGSTLVAPLSAVTTAATFAV